MLRALETGSDMLPGLTLLDLVREADAAGRLERMLPALEMIRARWESTSSYFTARGMALPAPGRRRRPSASSCARSRSTRAIRSRPRSCSDWPRRAGDRRRRDPRRATSRRSRPTSRSSTTWRSSASVNGVRSSPSARCAECSRATPPTRAWRPTWRSRCRCRASATRRPRCSPKPRGRARTTLTLHFNLGATLASLDRNQQALEHLEASQRLGNGRPSVRCQVQGVGPSGPGGRRPGRARGRRAAAPELAEIRELLAVLQGPG